MKARMYLHILQFILALSSLRYKLDTKSLSPPKPNLTKAQDLAIRELKKDRDCIVLTAGNGVAMVIM